MYKMFQMILSTKFTPLYTDFPLDLKTDVTSVNAPIKPVE